MEENEVNAKIAANLRNILNIDFLNDGPLLNSVSFVNLTHGQTLFNQGDEATHCFLVITGSVKIVMNNKKSESILTIISKGELGGAVLMEPQTTKFPGSLIAMSHTCLLMIPKKTFIDHWMMHTEARQFINHNIRNRMRYIHEDRHLQTSNVKNRVLNFLYRHYIEKGDLITKKITRKEIAMCVGAKTETIIRILKKFEHNGIIKTQNSIITILDTNYFLDNFKNEKE